MLCIEIWLNGERLCTGGLEDFGLLSFGFQWHNRPEPGDAWDAHPRIKLNATLEKAPFQSLSWLRKNVGIGDEITIKLIDSENFDKPSVTEMLNEDTKDTGIMKLYVAQVEETQRKIKEQSE